jgi:hypothetical protein
MEITPDPDLAIEAKALVAPAFRNGPTEDLTPEGDARNATVKRTSRISPTTR